MPNMLRTSISPSPRISMKCFTRSVPAPIRIPSPFRVTMTTSSATSRCPRSIRSSAISLLPIPERPISRTPTPYTSTSDPCTAICGANWSSRKSARKYAIFVVSSDGAEHRDVLGARPNPGAPSASVLLLVSTMQGILNWRSGRTRPPSSEPRASSDTGSRCSP